MLRKRDWVEVVGLNSLNIEHYTLDKMAEDIKNFIHKDVKQMVDEGEESTTTNVQKDQEMMHHLNLFEGIKSTQQMLKNIGRISHNNFLRP